MDIRKHMEVNLAREMLQAKLLSALFSQNLRNELILKGGMAMRAAGISERYTKDIDFSSPEEVSPERIRQGIRKAVRSVRVSGLVEDMKVSEPKQTDTTLRWKIGGKIGQTAINLTVEVSRRPGLPMEHVENTQWTPPEEYGLPPVMVDSINLEALAATKLACLGDRKREAPRDIYDLNILVMMEIKPPIAMLRALGPQRLQEFQEIVWAKLDKMTFEEAKTKLWPHLPEATRSQLDRDTWQTMRLRVGEKVDQWLSEALEEENDSGLAPS